MTLNLKKIVCNHAKMKIRKIPVLAGPSQISQEWNVPFEKIPFAKRILDKKNLKNDPK